MQHFVDPRPGRIGFVAQVVAEGHSARAARAAARQAALFERGVTGPAKRFMKELPSAKLEDEKRLFLTMCEDPRVELALAEFVSRTDVMPYQPKDSEKPS